MHRRSGLVVAAAVIVPLVGFASRPAAADDAVAPKPAAAPAAAPEKPATPAKPAAADASAAAVPAPSAGITDADRWPFTGAPSGDFAEIGGTPVHGDLTLRYRARWLHETTDQDAYQYLNLRIGDERNDKVSANFFVRMAEDLDGQQGEDGEGYVFDSLEDTSSGRVNTLLYTGYVTVRPDGGTFETMRFGRQYIYGGETFHMDGAEVTTRPIEKWKKLTFSVYGGIPVHFYEASSSGDYIAGFEAAAEPWKGGRAALDYTHVQDDLSILGTERNDLAAINLWQNVMKNVDVYGQYTWLEGPRDYTLRATYTNADQDLVAQASYYRLTESETQYATEFDPYYQTTVDLVRYQQGDLRVSKGFGDHWDVEVGGSARQLLPGEETSDFNRDTRRVYVTPTMTDIPWKGTSVSVTGESMTGDGERLQTWALDVSHRFNKTLKVSAGSDYSLYAYGPLGEDERSHVRTAYLRVKKALSESVTADCQYTWERDDVETFQILTLALSIQF